MNLSNVRFRSPDIAQLGQDGYFAVDMHFHTDHSDAPVGVEAVLKKAHKDGFGVAITDHNEVSGSLAADKFRKDVLVVPGMEVSAFDGPHILTYFYSFSDLSEFYYKHIEKRKQGNPWMAITLTTQEILDAAKGYNCLIIAAHPYGYLLFNKGLQKCIDKECLPAEILQELTGIEVICGGMTHSLNVMAMNLAREKELCYTGGTDGHMLSDLGGVVTCARADDRESFLDAIISRQNCVVGKEKSSLEKIATGTVLMTKHSRFFFPSMRIHYQQNAPRVSRYLNKMKKSTKEKKPK